MKKPGRFIFIILIVLVVAIGLFTFTLSPPIPERTEKIIDEVLATELPEQILGDTGRATSGDLEIWYESIKPPGPRKGILLLIMGLGGNAIEWPLYFVQPLVDAGYQVIRWDNRSTGLSTWPKEGYVLSDMAEDALAVMNELDVDSAHILGISMGGMIGQILAVEHPERVQTLTSLMSSGFTDDPELPPVSRTSYLTMVATAFRYGIPRTERNIVRTTVGVRSVLVPGLSPKRIRALAEQSLYNQRFRKGFNPRAFIQQTRAIRNAGSRYHGLNKLKIPTLVIHGKEDPLIPAEHGIKTAMLIPDAELLILEEMGHDLSPEHTPQIHKAILKLVE